MRMNIFIRISIFLSLVLFYNPVFGSGSLELSEIMYDVEGTDTGREWIEIYNASEIPIDLSTWKLFEAQVNHKITATTDVYVPAQGYAIVADNVDKFKLDYPAYRGLVFDSVFSLSNEGETIILRDDKGSDIDTISYDPSLGGVGDGSSIHKHNGTWVSGRVTLDSPYGGPLESTIPANSSTSPEVQIDNKTEHLDDTLGDGEGGGTVSSHVSQSPMYTRSVIPDFQVSAGRSRLGFVGVPVSFITKVTKAKNITSGSLVSTWSMGDGGFKNGIGVSHVYQFPGEYTVVLNAQWGESDAVSKTRIKIIEPQVDIERVSHTVVRISNNSSQELNLGGWRIESERNRYIIPIDTIVAGKGSIQISLNTIGISYVREFIRLVNPVGTVYKHIPFSNDIQIIIPDSIINK